MSSKLAIISVVLIVFAQLFTPALSVVKECRAENDNGCSNKKKAQLLKIIAMVSILVTSLIGVGLPLVTKSVRALSPDRNIFVFVKAFAAGIILATGFMHVLSDSFDMLSSECLKNNPWHKFPFAGFVAMLSAILAMMIDSMATSFYSKNNNLVLAESGTGDRELPVVESGGSHFHGGHGHHHGSHMEVEEGARLLRYRVIAMVLELGIIVHSIVIGLSLGASNNTCSIKGLVAALCFHQMFEGMGLGGCILQAEYHLAKKAAMTFFFAVTTPFGIAVGMILSSSYQENSPRSLITVGLLNASSAGILIYMALVDLLAADFMGPKLQASIKLQIKSYAAVLLGAGGMSLLAKWT